MGLGEEEEEGKLVVFSTVRGLGGGQGWRDTQWETVLRLVANLITPESLFHPLVVHNPPPALTHTHTHHQQLFHNPTSPLPRLLSLKQQFATDITADTWVS